MKTTIILFLLVMLTAVAFISRPSKASFRAEVEDRIRQDTNTLTGQLLAGPAADMYLRQVEFHNNVLWSTVRKDGQTLYVGVFSRWIPMEQSRQVIHEVVERASARIGA
jgi:hypothetical protein